ncbi:MAG TPA: ATP-binding protein [Armatimonadota bacterium]|nr:ATP-binding protein [Armatimonadota bacterium]
MKEPEGERLEFKEAKTRYDFEALVRYCVALANEGGGKMILGVSDKRPRRVVGSEAFPDFERATAGLAERIHLRVEAEVVNHPNGRVLVFDVPSRPIGMPIQYRATYWMRAGDSLVPMTPDKLKRIFDEAGPDFSAEICAKASIEDLDPGAIALFRERWIRKSGNAELAALSDSQLLVDAELTVEGGVTYAALVLLGTGKALGKHLGQAEVIFEYRSTPESVNYQQRREYREGFLLFEDGLWDLISQRNDLQHFRSGFTVLDIPTFNEDVVREAILNAVGHRDYRLGASVFARQFPRKLEVVSPGGFPPGINEGNILSKQFPRNRRIAEALSKCGLIERSGQGMNRMFKSAILESKPRPDFSGTDEYEVFLTLYGEIQDERLLRFLERVGRERLDQFSTDDVLALDLVHREKKVPPDLRYSISKLLDQGFIEHMSRNKYILSRALYGYLGQSGVYTRRRGLDHETNKSLLLKHILDCEPRGSRFGELMQVLPALTRRQVQRLLRELSDESKVCGVGRTSAVRWHAGPASELAP